MAGHKERLPNFSRSLSVNVVEKYDDSDDEEGDEWPYFIQAI